MQKLYYATAKVAQLTLSGEEEIHDVTRSTISSQTADTDVLYHIQYMVEN